MIRAFLFPTVCLLVVPLLCGCDDEQAKQELEVAQKKAATSAAAADQCQQELKLLNQALEDERTKTKKLEEYVARQRDTLVVATNQLEQVNLELTTANAKLTQENMELRTALAEMESLKQELASLKAAQEKPADE